MSSHSESQLATASPAPSASTVVATWDEDRPWDITVTKHSTTDTVSALKSAQEAKHYAKSRSAICFDLSHPKVLKDFFIDSVAPTDNSPQVQRYKKKHQNDIRLQRGGYVTICMTKKPDVLKERDAGIHRARYWVDNPDEQADGIYCDSCSTRLMKEATKSFDSWSKERSREFSEFWFYSDDDEPTGKINAMLHYTKRTGRREEAIKHTRAPDLHYEVHSGHSFENEPVGKGTTVYHIDLYGHR